MDLNHEILNELIDDLPPKELQDVKNHPYALTLIVDAQLTLQAKARELFKEIIIARDQPKKEIIELIRGADPNPEIIYYLLVESSSSHKKLLRETTSKQNSKNASNSRKQPSKEMLLKIKEEYQDNYSKEHGKVVERGWKKYAVNKLKTEYGSMDNRTINKIIKDQQ